MLVFDSLVDGFCGSMTERPSTLKLYRYAPGSSGPSVTCHRPSVFFVMAAPCQRPGMSVLTSFTFFTFGAVMRNVIFRSADSSELARDLAIVLEVNADNISIVRVAEMVVFRVSIIVILSSFTPCNQVTYYF